MGAHPLARQRRALAVVPVLVAVVGLLASPQAAAPRPDEPTAAAGPVLESSPGEFPASFVEFQGRRFPAGPHPLQGFCPAWNDGFNRYNTAISVRNMSGGAATVNVTYIDSDGNPQGTAVNTTLPAGAATSYATGSDTAAPFSVAGNLGVPSGSVGSAIIYSDQPIAGICTGFARNPSDELRSFNARPLRQQAVPPAGPYLETTTGQQSTLSTQYYVPLIFQDSSSQRSTNVQIQNVGTSSTTVEVEFFDNGNTSDGFASVTIPAMQSRLVSQSSTVTSPLLFDASAGSNADMFAGSATISSPSDQIVPTVITYGITEPTSPSPAAAPLATRQSSSTLEFTAELPALVPGSFLETFVAGVTPAAATRGRTR